MRTPALRRLADEIYVGAIMVTGAVIVAAAVWVTVVYGISFALWVNIND